MMNTAVLFLSTCIFGDFGSALATMPQGSLQLIDEGESKIDDITLYLLDGGRVELSQLQGKVVLIQFWWSKCPLCKTESMALRRLDRKYREKGLSIIGISIETSHSAIRDFVKELKITWPQCGESNGWVEKLRATYHRTQLPDFWIFDKRGRARFRGATVVEERIQQLLEEQ